MRRMEGKEVVCGTTRAREEERYGHRDGRGGGWYGATPSSPSEDHFRSVPHETSAGTDATCAGSAHRLRVMPPMTVAADAH
mmetsp:Transcript_21630/g.52243  ORF Transcript_21630/g.52243 Transcript_21630/m.52243 type:complete len:81 (-) Transcript_21630:37-279(-)